MPALFTSTLIPPRRSSASEITCATSFSFETSRCQYSAIPPLSLICCTTFLLFSSRRSVSATFAPSCARSFETALPIPPAAPLTIATFPLTLSTPPSPCALRQPQTRSITPSLYGNPGVDHDQLPGNDTGSAGLGEQSRSSTFI